MNTATQLSSSFVFVRKQNILYKVFHEDICYIQAEGNYCYIVTRKGSKYASKISLRQLVQRLPEDQFIRIHKSYVVNFCQLSKIDTKERLAYIEEEVLPIGRTFLSGLTNSVLII